MKKIYLSPVMDVIELKNRQALLTGSLPMSDTEITNQNEILAPDYDNFDFE